MLLKSKEGLTCSLAATVKEQSFDWTLPWPIISLPGEAKKRLKRTSEYPYSPALKQTLRLKVMERRGSPEQKADISVTASECCVVWGGEERGGGKPSVSSS